MFLSRYTVCSTILLIVDRDGSVRLTAPEDEESSVEAAGRQLPDALPGEVLAELESGASSVHLSVDTKGLDFSVFPVAPGGPWLLFAESEQVGSGPRGGIPDVDEMAYRAFFEQAPVGIIHLDVGGRVTFENHALRQIVGEMPEDAWLGRHVGEIPVLAEFSDRLIDEVLAGGSSLDGEETQMDRQDGDLRQLRILGAPIKNSDGMVVGGVLTIQDVTESRRAEELARKAREAAEKASRMKSALIATISHELRTPAGTIHGYASMLEQELREMEASALPSKVPLEFAETIRVRAGDLVRLVGDLTELSQLETGKVALQPEVIDVEALIAESVDHAPDPSEGVRISVDACPGVFVRADRLRLRHVLDKVVGNAFKFTLDGEVRVSCSPSDGNVCIVVTDTGVGIDPAALAGVFDPFTQEDDPLNRRFEGAGLGLSIVRRLLELMHGRIEIESRKGGGTTVRLYLPASDRSSDAS